MDMPHRLFHTILPQPKGGHRSITAASKKPSFHENKTYIVDTTDVYCAIQEDELERPLKRGLKKVCAAYGIEAKNMHNAGNDAHVSVWFLCKISPYFELASFSIPCSP